MATVNYASEANAASGYTKVEWTGLSPSDVGQEFNCAGMQIGSVHVWGSFDGNIYIQGSNEISPANFKEITNMGAGETIRDYSSNNAADFVGSIRPALDGSTGTGNVAIIFRAVS